MPWEENAAMLLLGEWEKEEGVVATHTARHACSTHACPGPIQNTLVNACFKW